MTLRPLLDHLARDPAGKALLEGGTAVVSQTLRPYAIAALAADRDDPLLVVTSSEDQARELAHELGAWLAPQRARWYPSRGVAYKSHLAPPPHLIGLRIAAIDALVEAGNAEVTTWTEPPPVIVASAAALAELIPDPELRPSSMTLKKGDLIDLDEVSVDLIDRGYERVEQVEDRGQFAIRGGLLDLFPATSDNAVRIDLFDIEIESIRSFSTFTQRSISELNEVEIAPAAELKAELRVAPELAADENERPDIAELLPLDRFVSPLDLIGDAGVVVLSDIEMRGAIAEHELEVSSTIHADDADKLYLSAEALTKALDERTVLRLELTGHEDAPELRAQAPDAMAATLREAEGQLEQLIRSGYRVVVTWPQKGEGERAAFNLARVKHRWIGEGGGGQALGLGSGDAPEQGVVDFAVSPLSDGFVAASIKLAVIPIRRLLRRRRAKGDNQRRGRGVLRSFADLRLGDIVVHEDHGVARFAGFDTKTVAGVTRDYLELEFQGSDRVFLPTEQLAKISRYVGADGAHPPLSKLGGKSWETMRARARKAAQQLAGELLNLYAERKRRTGHPFPRDSDWQVAFEERFPHRETADQLEAIELVKEDMESPRPMDRLLCGDVGFGKTEVALRAAFKAVADGKQVMVLAPTTILAQQHFGTFSERMRDYPFSVDLVSRFRSAADQNKAIEGFTAGKVDILIGTHRLLGKDVRPKDLGLLILDEEQRFGVKQKELMRQLRLRVDVLAMSATPIPRTLQMSLAGIRDISVIATPPEGRRAVKTIVGEYDEEQVRMAIARELGRKGQAFFLHNRVESIDETAERLRGLLPEAKVVVAHGQMDETELEEKMMSFVRGEADVLVSTSIIETGIDVPSANTLIIDRADLFGLSQLHQIRGRVGRSAAKAYAYMLYPSANELTKQAAERLSALADHSDLGAGLKIAMRDLELRGAGNLLGDEQSGHVAALGFELYLQMIDEAVRAMGGMEEGDGDDEEVSVVRLDVTLDAYVPAGYIGYEQAKIDVHRRIAGATGIDEIFSLRNELTDRFGGLPEPLENLLHLQQARILLGRAGAKTVSVRAGKITATPIDLDSAGLKRLRGDVPGVTFDSGRQTVVAKLPEGDELAAGLVAFAEGVLAAVEETRERARPAQEALLG
ncbi:MAG: transcription-repair coupling factor [Patulibacter sp.]|nr:transcription-repair coupling factor [Patulibacter sp.]